MLRLTSQPKATRSRSKIAIASLLRPSCHHTRVRKIRKDSGPTSVRSLELLLEFQLRLI